MRSSLCTIACALLEVIAAVSASSVKRDANSSTQCRQTKVLILGAGEAGITAAQALTNQSVTDFLIVEYNNDIGGRVRHAPFGKKPDGSPYTIELGANWVQGLGAPGGPQNPIWTLAQKYNLSTEYSNYDSLLTYDEHGFNNYTDLVNSYDDYFTALQEDAGYILTQNLLDNNVKTGLALTGWIPQTPIEQATDWWSWDFEDAYSPEKSGELFGIVGYNATRDYYSDVDNFVIDQRGFNSFIKGQASSFLQPNDARLLLNTIVTNVSYSDDSVTVRTKNNTCIKADYAICTFSLGVLQNSLAGKAPVTFSPTFPRWKQQAIQGWDMATYTKIFYQFPPEQQFWDDSTQYFLYADPVTRGAYPIWQSLSLPGFFPNSGIFFVTVTDDQSFRVERQSDEQTKQEGLDVLRKMFPNKTIPEPIDFMYPRWGNIPWAYGTYSNSPVGVTLKEHQNLRASLKGRLWFAGEATSAEFYGFLQGAYFEGKRAGEAVAKCVKRNGTCSGEVHYKTLAGTTPANEYDAANGWDVSTFATYGISNSTDP